MACRGGISVLVGLHMVKWVVWYQLDHSRRAVRITCMFLLGQVDVFPTVLLGRPRSTGPSRPARLGSHCSVNNDVDAAHGVVQLVTAADVTGDPAPPWIGTDC